MSSPIELGQEVLAAQGRVFAQTVKRHGVRVVFAIIAAIFLLFAAISLHGVLWTLFLGVCHFSPLNAALCVMGIDILFALIFLLLAMRARHSTPSEERAILARDQKLQELKRSIGLSALLSVASGPVGRFAGGRVLKMVKLPFGRRKKR
ncbi:hypothetical protein GT348_01255 [Aristophania vespae]|uniref:Phage holin family protein n=1 Tax=Aristophania vespae TaxID=2697033 RepID=A0A6P1NHG5_9PROT|nr:hypothetical protein [Aristophania vespae]QHI95102.1 hypothetical protein GT348_01255 [Aristophania vespae]UMM64301.1 hypothetical protein DM15PD_13130 [Aristophania vespae]